MHRHGSTLLFSASDLSRFLGCRHRTGLDLAVANGTLERIYIDDPQLELLWQRGLEHEAAYVDRLRAEGRTVVDVRSNGRNLDAAYALTLDAMRTGVDVIVQGTLHDGQWMGRPDIMHRVDRPSALGAWSYEVADTKLARDTKAGTILQLCLYSELLAAAQQRRPEQFHVVTPDPVHPVETYRVDDYAAYFRLIRSQLLATVAHGDEHILVGNYPEPVEHCEICDWSSRCSARRREDDHLSLVAGITRTQRRELESRAVPTLAALAGMPVPIDFRPQRGSAQAFERVREQARVQFKSRDKTVPVHELLAVDASRGLSRLPEPTLGDLFLDLEGDPFVGEGGREYLFGVVTADGSYHSRWGITEAEERAAFEWFMDLVAERAAQYPDMHVYHYAPYEPSALKRLMGRYATRERELDAMLRSGRLVDLYAVVREALRIGVERYSIKNLEPLYGFTRAVTLGDAGRSLRQMEYALELGQSELMPDELRKTVAGYNRDDCVSTLALRDWLEVLRAQLIVSGTDVPRRLLDDGAAPDAVDDRTRAVDALRHQLLAGVPEARPERNAEQQGRWLLAYMLDYHRREEKSTWWEYFQLCGLSEEQLFDERDAIAGLTFVERVGFVPHKTTGKPTKSVVDRYTYPVQEMEIGASCHLKTQDKRNFAEAVAVDPMLRIIDLQKGPSRADEHPNAVFAFDYVPSKPIEDALMRIGETIAAGHDGYRAARALLGSEAPRLKRGAFDARIDEAATDLAVRIVGELDETVLPIQGPPGAGKTYCGARMICELIRQGKTVGVTANSHAVIRNLLGEIVRASRELGVDTRVMQRVSEPKPGDESGIVETGSDDDALDALGAGDANVLGGTAWLWSKPNAHAAVDVLFVDEAGQIALANVVAVSQAAGSVVLLGDPQQLEQPRKGSHPDGVGVSALQHLLGDHLTIASERGIFLPETWRMTPSICAFTSELFYEGRLTSRAGLEHQCLTGADTLPSHGLLRIDVEHEGNRNYSIEEVEAVAALVARLTSDGVHWVDNRQQSQQLCGTDILVVSPYNAQVNRLKQRLDGTGVSVGTVDKFQGQQAPVVIYSMATSRPDDAPRGMEFLYSLNRLNVATSRAKCLAVLVASPKLFAPECRTPRQMRLANGMARFAELART